MVGSLMFPKEPWCDQKHWYLKLKLSNHIHYFQIDKHGTDRLATKGIPGFEASIHFMFIIKFILIYSKIWSQPFQGQYTLNGICFWPWSLLLKWG